MYLLSIVIYLYNFIAIWAAFYIQYYFVSMQQHNNVIVYIMEVWYIYVFMLFISTDFRHVFALSMTKTYP